MRDKLPGFDPFYRAWSYYDDGGLDNLEEIEAPIFMYPLDEADPVLANKLVKVFGSQDPHHPENGLIASDLRFGIMPDAFPVPVRDLAAGEEIGVHLNTFGSHQVRYGKATEVERRGLEVITFETEELVRDALTLAHGASQMQFGEQVPTLHRHVIGREREMDGLENLSMKTRTKVDVQARRDMRARLAHEITPERMYKIALHLGEALGQFVID